MSTGNLAKTSLRFRRGNPKAGEAANFTNCLFIAGKNGTKSGRARRCE